MTKDQPFGTVQSVQLVQSEPLFRAQADTLRLGASPLSSSCYAGAEFFADELALVFGRRWICVARSSDLPESGSYLTFALGAERLLVVRGFDGELAAFDNVCRHRGSLLRVEPSGTVPGMLRCPLHGWTYGLDGRLVVAPFMDEVPGFDLGSVSLPRLATAEWEGFVFVHLGSDPAPFEQAWAAVRSAFTRWGLANLSVTHRTDYLIEANWKLVVENYSECYHCPSIHRRFAERCPFRSGHNDRHDGPFLGGFMELNAQYTTLSVDDGGCAPTLVGLHPADHGRVYFYALFPNLLLSLHPDYVVAYTLWPIAPDRTLARCTWLFAAPDGNTEPWNPSGAIAFWDEANREDFEALALVQQGLSTARHRPGPYSRLESLAAAFDDHLLAVLDAERTPIAPTD